MGDFRSLIVYRKAFSLAMDIFKETKGFPKEERFSLVDQMRRSSRSVCACVGEAYRKRQYPKHFQSKLSDAAMENAESMVWFDFSLACKYISKEKYNTWNSDANEIGKMLHVMINRPEKFKPKK